MSMDEPHLEGTPVSKVKLIRNAKGDPQWEITVVPGTSDELIDVLRRQALHQYKALELELLNLNRDAA